MEKTTTYLGGVEKVVTPTETYYKRYIAGVAIQTFYPNTQVERTEYLLKDHLGSMHTVMDEVGQILFRLHFDAHGNRKEAGNWQQSATTANILLYNDLTPRGFTGHEHVDNLGLIHMNGRIYDPKLGRFLQADPFVQAPTNTQSLNRYTYVFNNPLSYTDPSGFISLRQIGAIAITAIAIATQQYWAVTAASKFWGTVAFAAAAGYVQTGTLRGAFYSAIAAAAFYGIGQYFEGAGWAQAEAGTDGIFSSGLSGAGYAAKVAAHGAAGGTLSKLQGGRFGHGFASAGVTQAAAPGIDNIGDGASSYAAARVVAAAVVGGTASRISGGKFGNGAVTAAFSRAFNEESHSRNQREIRQQANAARERIRSFSEQNPGETIALSEEELNAIMTDEAISLEKAQERFGSYRNLSLSEFHQKLLYAGDSFFAGYAGSTFSLYGTFPFSGTWRAEDINYYYQGFVTAAAGGSLFAMNVRNDFWNIKQAFTRPSLHDIRQIVPANLWSVRGYYHYRNISGN